MNKVDYFNDKLVNNGKVLFPGEGEKIEIGGLELTLKITSNDSNDQLGVYKIALAPQTIGAKPHYHRFMDETFIVNRGVLTIQVGDEEKDLPSGSVVFVPRFTPHGFANNTDENVEITLIFNPSQKREGFFYGLYETLTDEPIDPAKYLKLYNKYDSYPIDTSNMLPVK